MYRIDTSKRYVLSRHVARGLKLLGWVTLAGNGNRRVSGRDVNDTPDTDQAATADGGFDPSEAARRWVNTSRAAD
jgi:hypothetical protein